MQAMAQSKYKDLVLGDSVKVETSIEELVAAFGSDQPLVFQVGRSSGAGSTFRKGGSRFALRRSAVHVMQPGRCSAAQRLLLDLPVQVSIELYLHISVSQVGFDVQPEVTWKSSYRELKVRRGLWLPGRHRTCQTQEAACVRVRSS